MRSTGSASPHPWRPDLGSQSAGALRCESEVEDETSADPRTGRKPPAFAADRRGAILARRAAHECNRQGTSYEALAIQMHHRGCPETLTDLGFRSAGISAE